MAILIFGLLVFVHELGHFLAARAFDVKVTDFAIGMGPAIWKKQKGETLYSVRAVPFGGYCKMEEDEEVKNERSFNAKPWWQRFIILFAGAFMNVALGFLIAATIASVRMETFNLFAMFRSAFNLTFWAVSIVFESFVMLFTGQVGVEEFIGPVGIVDAIGTVAQAGTINILYLTVLLTVNLGILNLLPLPALDGGRIIFVLIEAVRRKPVPPEKEGIIHFVGIVLLLGFALFVTYNDILRLITGGGA